MGFECHVAWRRAWSALGVCGAVLSALAAPVPPARAAPSSISLTECPRIFPSIAWRTLCVPAWQTRSAESQLAFVPLSPQTMVWRQVHWPLRFVALFQVGKRVTSINYFFGDAVVHQGVPDLWSPQSHYVIVAESLSRHTAHATPTIRRDVTREGGSSGPRTLYGPWFFTSAVPNRPFTISVQSRDSRNCVRTIGLALLDAASHTGLG